MGWDRLVRHVAIVALAFTLSGCATIVSDRKYEVTVDNNGGPTYFAVRDRKNQVVETGVTPQQVRLNAQSSMFRPAKYQVDFVGQDGVQSRDLDAKVDPWIAGNIVVGGVPGLVVDGASGAMWRLDNRVVGQIPAHMLVGNATQGAEVLAGRSKASGTGSDAVNPKDNQKIRTASYGVEP